ncbi:MAG: CopG family transcriptional regulator [Chloroflexota bacterium]
MMEKQNVTLALPKDILRQAKILAIKKNTSLSNLLTQTLTELVSQADAYSQAQERYLTLLLQDGADLGSNGQVEWSREALHER